MFTNTDKNDIVITMYVTVRLPGLPSKLDNHYNKGLGSIFIHNDQLKREFLYTALKSQQERKARERVSLPLISQSQCTHTDWEKTQRSLVVRPRVAWPDKSNRRKKLLNPSVEEMKLAWQDKESTIYHKHRQKLRHYKPQPDMLADIYTPRYQKRERSQLPPLTSRTSPDATPNRLHVNKKYQLLGDGFRDNPVRWRRRQLYHKAWKWFP